MDVGVWMSPAVLAHKLHARREPNPEQAWNLVRWPSRLSGSGHNRLFVASSGVWRGYFVLAPDALFNPRDPRAPYTLLFDSRTWTPIPPVPVKPFRGFTYSVPVPTTTPSSDVP